MPKTAQTRDGVVPLYQKIQREIARQITTAELAPGDPLPTRSDLAARYRTTRATVDRAMQELARQGFVTAGSGRRTLVTGVVGEQTACSIAVVWSFPGDQMGSSEGDYFVQLLGGVREACAELGVEPHFRPAQLSAFANTLSETRAQGLLVVRPDYNDGHWLERLAAEGIPLVAAPGILNAEHVHSISSDNFLGMRQAVDHLVGLGHRDIGVVSLTTMPDHFERLQGFLQAMAAHGLRVDPRWILVGNEEGVDGYVRAVRGGLAEGDPLPTALIAADLLMGLAVQRRLRELGRSVPGDVSLVNFDDTPAAAHMTPALTVVKQQTRMLGSRGVHRLVQLIRGDADVPRVERLPTQLIVRESTASPPR